jgi:hypothetical protein
MADALRLQITGDASDAQSKIQLVVDNTKGLQDALSGAGASGLEAGNEIAENMDKANYSMMEARHAAMMLGEETGVHIPRALSGIAARSEVLGPLLAKAFSGIALIAFAELIVKATEKFSEWIVNTFILTESLKAMDSALASNNKNIVASNAHAAELASHYDEIGVSGAALSKIKLDKMAEDIKKTDDALSAMKDKLYMFRTGMTAMSQAEVAQSIGLPDSATAEQITATISGKIGELHAKMLEQQQEFTNEAKVYTDQQTKDEEEAMKKRVAMVMEAAKAGVDWTSQVKLNATQQAEAVGLIAQAHRNLMGEIDKEAAAISDKESEELKKQLDLELKSGEAIEKAADAALKLNAATAKSAAETQADVVARDKAQGLTHQQVADTQKLVTLLQAQKAAELAIVDAKMAEAQAAMDAAKTSGPGGGLNIPDYNNALAQYRDYQAQRVQLAADANKKIQAAIDTELKNETKEYQSYLQSFNTQFASAFAQVATAHETLSKAASKMYQQMSEALLKNLATAAMAEIEGAALHRTLAQQKQLTDAKGAAGGAYNAVAGIPIIGPVLAPIAAGVAFAGVMAFDEGGMVPEDQMSMVHADEAVLNPKQTENFQKMAEEGGGDTYNTTHNHTWNTMDSKSLQDFAKRNPGFFATGVQHAVKNGHLDVNSLAKGK